MPEVPGAVPRGRAVLNSERPADDKSLLGPLSRIQALAVKLESGREADRTVL